MFDNHLCIFPKISGGQQKHAVEHSRLEAINSVLVMLNFITVKHIEIEHLLNNTNSLLLQ
jgi:hypothetical protein